MTSLLRRSLLALASGAGLLLLSFVLNLPTTLERP